MRHRHFLSEKERKARSKAAQLVHDKPLIIGSLVEMARTCGKSRCKCITGEKHKSWYLSLRQDGKRKMIHISRGCEEAIFEGVETYQELWKQMDAISQTNLKRIVLSHQGKR